MTGAVNRSAIDTLMERTTRFTILLYVPDGHTSERLQEALIREMGRLPELMRSSLIWDLGSELALHREIPTALDMGVCFCDPHSPWQRGTNENTNWLLCQCFPKGADMSVYQGRYLDAAAEELNDRQKRP